jgi:hypothetical protein
MKTLNLSLLFFLFSITGSFSQTFGDTQYSVEIGVSKNNFVMTQFNQNIVDYYINEIERLQEHIKNGTQISVGLKLKMRNSFSFGLNITHSRATTEYMAKANAFEGNELILIDWYTMMRTTAFQFNTTLNFNALSLIKNTKAINNENTSIALGPEFSFGLGLAQYSSYTDVPWLNLYTQNLFRAQGTALKIGAFMEFNLKKSQIYGIGFRTGYQFFETNTLKLHTGEAIIGFGETPPNLDFSGFYYGIYLKFGK